MASRKDYFFRQKVTEAELDAGFAYMEQADWNQAVDHGLVGLLEGMAVTQRAAGANLSVDIAAGRAHSKLGERLFIGATQNFDVSVDKDGVTTAVAGGGNSKILSVFVKFKRAQLDPRTDGNNNNVFFDQPESFEFKLIQSAEAPAPVAPAVQADWILLADLTRAFGQNSIVNANISTSRTEKQFIVAGAPRAISSGKIKDALTELLTFYNNHVSGAADQHAATALTASIAALWADGTGIVGATVDAALEEIVTDLAGVAGANKIGAGIAATWRDATGIAGATIDAVLEEILTDLAAQANANEGALRIGAFQRISGAVTLPTGSVGSQITALLNAHVSHLEEEDEAHDASAITATIAATWADASGIAATKVSTALAEIVTDLAAVSGANKIGAAIAATWRDATGIVGATIDAVLEEIVTDIAQNTASGNDGAGRVGSGGRTAAPLSLAQGSVGSQLAELLTHIADHLNDAVGAHASTAISGAIAATWADGTGIVGTTVDAIEEEIVTDLAASTGARKIGTEASFAFDAERLDTRLANLEVIGAGYYGDGSGGTTNISSGTTVLTDDTNYDSLTISGTGILEPDSFVVVVQGTLTMTASTIRFLGNAASGITPGAASNSVVLGGGNTGGTPTATNGGGGTGSSTAGVGGVGGAGGDGSGGTGGAGGVQGISAAFGASTITHLPFGAMQTFTSGAGIANAVGGSGGGAGGGDGAGTEAGAGGGGGGCLVIRAFRIDWSGTGTVSVRGGNGGNAVGTNCGGGGGGGGGFITLVFRWEVGSRDTITTGGSGGTKTGTGVAGNSGLTGRVIALTA